MKKQFQMTKEGLEELQQELAALVANRSAIAERIKTAREFGDLSENAEYSSARLEQEKAESRIAEIENIILNVEIIKKPANDQVVRLGSSVTLKSGSQAKQFQVVGTVEADPMSGKISDESPIGQALLGKKVGDSVEIKTPAESITYTVAAIG
jgi:transcription elongation factor GreA